MLCQPGTYICLQVGQLRLASANGTPYKLTEERNEEMGNLYPVEYLDLLRDMVRYFEQLLFIRLYKRDIVYTQILIS